MSLCNYMYIICINEKIAVTTHSPVLNFIIPVLALACCFFADKWMHTHIHVHIFVLA